MWQKSLGLFGAQNSRRSSLVPHVIANVALKNGNAAQ
jgi:hypothetical protein